MKPRLAFVLLVAAAACCLLAASALAGGDRGASLGKAAALSAPAGRQANCPAGVGLDAPAAAQESAMLCLVGEARERRGLPPLARSETLQEAASAKAADILRCDEFSHTACGRPFTYWIEESGYMSARCWRAGENLAWGVGEEGTVSAIFRAWMHSPAHRANILGDFEETGIDLHVGQLGGLTGVNLWTQHFGTHCGS